MLKDLDGNLLEELPIWRLVSEGMATKEEIDRSYSFVDICKANAVLDMKSDIEAAVGEILTPKQEA